MEPEILRRWRAVCKVKQDNRKRARGAPTPGPVAQEVWTPMHPERNRSDGEPIVIGRLEPDDNRGLYNALTVAVRPPDDGVDPDFAEFVEPQPAAIHVFVTSFIDERELGVTREGGDIEQLIGFLRRARAIANALDAGHAVDDVLSAADTTEADAIAPSIDRAAVDALIAGVRAERDFGGWLGRILAAAAAELGSTAALTVGRPGAWEAEHVRGLVNGTAGWDDEYLADYRLPSRGARS